MAPLKAKKAVAPTATTKQGAASYYKTKIEELEVIINEKTQDLRRLEAQRNQLNGKGESLHSSYGALTLL